MLRRCAGALAALTLVQCSLLLGEGLSGAPAADAEGGSDSAIDAGAVATDASDAGDAGAGNTPDASSVKPELVAMVGAATTTIAADAAHVYWGEGASVRRIVVSGPGSVEIVGAANGLIQSLALNDRYVVWGDTSETYNVLLKTAPGAAPHTRTCLGSAGKVTIDGQDNVAWATSFGDIAARRTSTTSSYVVARLANATTVIADTTTLYFFGTPQDAGSSLNLWWCPNSECVSAANPNGPLAVQQDAPKAIAAGGGRVVWLGPQGTLRSATIATPAPTIMTTGQTGATAIAAGSTAAYFTTNDAVWKVPFAGGPPTPLALAQAAPSAIAVNATHVFWFCAGDATIRRLLL